MNAQAGHRAIRDGPPLAVIELKNPADENAAIWSAHRQLQTHQAQIPSIFVYMRP
jgi:type I restriction enzyme R subunit